MKELSKEKTKTAHPPPKPEVHTLVRELQTELAEMKPIVLASMSTGKPQNSKQMAENKDTLQLQDQPRQRRGRKLRSLLQVWSAGSHLQGMQSSAPGSGILQRVTVTSSDPLLPLLSTGRRCRQKVPDVQVVQP